MTSRAPARHVTLQNCVQTADSGSYGSADPPEFKRIVRVDVCDMAKVADAERLLRVQI